MLSITDDGVESSSFDSLSTTVPLLTEPSPKPRRLKGMPQKKLRERIPLGHGLGDGRDYLPWLTLRKKNSSPDSNQVCSWMPPLRRFAHYFSRGEYHTALFYFGSALKTFANSSQSGPFPTLIR
jgi:hypothetical protein